MTTKAAPAASKARELRDRRAWRVLQYVCYPSDDAELARLVGGEDIPFDARKLRRAYPGEVVRDVPSISVDALIAGGVIEPAGAAAAEVDE